MVLVNCEVLAFRISCKWILNTTSESKVSFVWARSTFCFVGGKKTWQFTKQIRADGFVDEFQMAFIVLLLFLSFTSPNSNWKPTCKYETAVASTECSFVCRFCQRNGSVGPEQTNHFCFFFFFFLYSLCFFGWLVLPFISLNFFASQKPPSCCHFHVVHTKDVYPYTVLYGNRTLSHGGYISQNLQSFYVHRFCHMYSLAMYPFPFARCQRVHCIIYPDTTLAGAFARHIRTAFNLYRVSCFVHAPPRRAWIEQFEWRRPMTGSAIVAPLNYT